MIGEIPGIAAGSHFPNRRELHDAGIHRGLQNGIGGGGESIVLSGGYVDDIDDGDLIIYTGAGGQNSKRVQIADQTFTESNLKLANQCVAGNPIRVVRGNSKIGYTYAGLFWIEAYWREPGVHGFLVCRYRLMKIDSEASSKILDEEVNFSRSAPTDHEDQKPVRRETYTVRVIRNSSKANWVKNLYSNVCQISGRVLTTSAGRYSEGCHIKPVGKPHDGPDSVTNILCLCPDMHVLFDRGSISIADDFSLLGMEGRLEVHAEHNLSQEYIQYHRQHIFLPV